MTERRKDIDSVVIVTVITTDAARRDEIDKLIDGLTADPRVRVVRVAGYAQQAEAAAMFDEIAAKTGKLTS